MKAVLLTISFVFLLSASVFASVLVIEGYEEFKLASLDDAVTVIGSNLVDKNLLTRRRAISTLSSLLISGKVGLARYVEEGSPIRLLTSDRVENINVSFQLRDEIVSSLIHSLHDEDTTNRKMAVITLGKSGDKRAIDPLSERLKVENDPKVIEEIEKALENLSHPRSREKRSLR
ncbi:MAG: HEAT repeat domain-containing protein [Candidatus Tectomicrobia bacterium]|uniref:HEAT repeat domain-containing protein n=1 Tax=Tectimicrobiota bacterium TaxID=2528274 RepID=A0A932FWY5_UNCTE|nr:HEAT repeat domain-containing protein [Candidatus Tectomicrobia bacterium]